MRGDFFNGLVLEADGVNEPDFAPALALELVVEGVFEAFFTDFAFEAEGFEVFARDAFVWGFWGVADVA